MSEHFKLRKTYPAHGSGVIVYYAPADIDPLIANLTRERNDAIAKIDETLHKAVKENIDLIKYEGFTIREWISHSQTLTRDLEEARALIERVRSAFNACDEERTVAAVMALNDYHRATQAKRQGGDDGN